MAKVKPSDKNPAATIDISSVHGLMTDGPAATLAEARARVMVAVPYVRKRGEMKGFGNGNYRFVRDSDVIAILRGPMIENGLVISGPVEITNETFDTFEVGKDKSRMFRARAKFWFELEHWPSKEVKKFCVYGCGADSFDKDCNKMASNARKYAYLMAFSLTTGDDPDGFDEDGMADGAQSETRGPGTSDDRSGRPAPRPAPSSPPHAPAQAPAPPPVPPAPPAPDSLLPQTGKELQERLDAYDRKLTDQKFIVRGQLIAAVIAEGIRAGYPADITQWTAPAIVFAVSEVKHQEAVIRDQASAREREAKSIAEREAQAVAGAGASPGPSPASTSPPAPSPAPAPAPAKPPLSPAERFERRIRGMEQAPNESTLNQFRSKYAADSEMTKVQAAELEKCYWANIARVRNAPAPSAPAPQPQAKK